MFKKVTAICQQCGHKHIAPVYQLEYIFIGMDLTDTFIADCEYALVELLKQTCGRCGGKLVESQES